ncbi:hypothetical protein KYJ26_00355 [Bacillus sp. MCCB 382]|uniref:hypothetical protein n=1 Tax=Bacillus sp. MCCB 382 TaxID=2860197 RepID=UPI001C56E6D3|nr:hypothetical protein [Bacillus sp. MCCB 382]
MDIEKLLSSYFCRINNIDLNKCYSIEIVDACDLLVKERIDLVAKIKYVEFKDKGYDLSFIKELYAAHIEAFSLGSFSEPGNSEKNTIEKYIKTFDNLIDNIKNNGINKDKSVIPVGYNNAILDGAHRVAIAAYYKLKVPIIRFNNLSATYDVKYFKERLLDERYIDYLVNEYCKLKGNQFVACVWPKAKDKDKRKELDALINNSCEVIYKKKIKVGYDGLHNLMFQIYSGQGWIGNIKNNFEGAKNKRDACYDKNEILTAYVIENISFEDVLNLKKKIRDIFNIGNHSIHITDTKEEVVQMVNLLLNENSVQFLNNGKPNHYVQFNHFIDKLKAKLIEYNLPLEEFTIDSSSTMALYGLRDVEDIDFLTISKEYKVLEDDYFHNHHDFVKYYNQTLDNLVLNPQNYFYFSDLKFTTLDVILEFKKNRFEYKDQVDVKLIENIMKKKSKLNLALLKLESSIKRTVRNIKMNIKKLIIISVKKMGVYNYVKRIYKSLRG